MVGLVLGGAQQGQDDVTKLKALVDEQCGLFEKQIEQIDRVIKLIKDAPRIPRDWKVDLIKVLEGAKVRTQIGLQLCQIARVQIPTALNFFKLALQRSQQAQADLQAGRIDDARANIQQALNLFRTAIDTIGSAQRNYEAAQRILNDVAKTLIEVLKEYDDLVNRP